MTEYTDDVDQAIRDSPRTIQSGDVVAHEDAPYFMLGKVFEIAEDGTASVEWPGVDVHDGIPVGRLRYIERPEAYVCVEYNGHDELTGMETTYRFVRTGHPDFVLDECVFFQEREGYTIVDSYVPVPQDDAENGDAGTDTGA